MIEVMVISKVKHHNPGHEADMIGMICKPTLKLPFF